MSYNFFKEELKILTEKMSIQQASLFSLYNCSRIVNLYKLINIQYNFGNYNLVENMLDFLWEKLLNSDISNSKIQDKFSNIELLIPNSEKYHGTNSILALNVIICLDITYKCVVNQINNANLTSLYIYDSIEKIILSKSPNIKFITNEVVFKIDNTDTVINEIRNSKNIAATLLKTSVSERIVLELKNKAKLEKINVDNIEGIA